MDKKIVGLAGALVAIAAPAHATPAAPTMSRAEAYADLLKPIPNAIEELKTADAASRQPETPRIEPAQYWGGYHHHHHHHHGYYYGRGYYGPGYYQPGYPYRWRRHHNWYYHHHHHHWGD